MNPIRTVLITAMAAALPVLAVAVPATAAGPQPTPAATPSTGLSPVSPALVALDYGSTGWSYQQVPAGTGTGFEAATFDASGWAVGRAGFGSTVGPCGWNTPDRVHTDWAVGTDLLVRREFMLPRGTATVHVSGTVDNNADVYVNGVLVQHVENGFCQADGINIDLPATVPARHNVIAIRARDLGTAAFLDVRVTYTRRPCHRGGPSAAPSIEPSTPRSPAPEH